MLLLKNNLRYGSVIGKQCSLTFWKPREKNAENTSYFTKNAIILMTKLFFFCAY